MNKCILLATSISVLVAGTGAAMASIQGYYFSGLAGASLLPSLGMKDSTGKSDSTFDAGYAYGGAFGYDTGQGWRVELSLIYQLSTVDQFNGAATPGHLWSTGFMANGTYDLTQGTQFTPYVGAGLGVQDVGGVINGLSGDKWRPAYQLEAGLRDDLTPKVSLFGEYRFLQSEATKLSDTTDMANQHFSDHLLMVGLSYHLGQN